MRVSINRNDPVNKLKKIIKSMFDRKKFIEESLEESA